MRKLHVAALCGLVVMAVQLSGCAAGRPINASHNLSKQNAMNKVAVFGTSRVVWPRMFGKEPVLGLEASKETLNAVLPMLRSQMQSKGYDVAAVEAVGIYPYPQFKEDWVFPMSGEFQDPDEEKKAGTEAAETADSSDFGKPYQLVDKQAAYIYPSFAQNASAHSAARTVFEHIDSQLGIAPLAPGASAQTGDASVTAPAEAMNLLREQTGADTLCFANVQGHRFTAARKAGVIAMNLLTAMFGVVTVPPQDAATLSLTCYSPDSTGLAWQNVFQNLGDPEKPNPKAVTQLLSLFPARGEPLNAGCVPNQKIAMQYLCKPVKQSKQG